MSDYKRLRELAMGANARLPRRPYRAQGGDVSDKPIRVQLSRRKGWKMPPNTVKVDRSTVFGNISTCTRPHHCALQPCDCCPDDNDGWCCVLAFEEYVRSGIERRESRTGLFRYAVDAWAGYPQRDKLIARLPELRGKNLACWCPLSEPCHADVLLQIANAPDVWRCPDCGNEARFNHRGCHIFADAP